MDYNVVVIIVYMDKCIIHQNLIFENIFESSCYYSQTVDKAPGLRRGFSSVVINIPIIFPLFIKKNSLYQLEN